MNYLAHLYLAGRGLRCEPDDAFLFGNLLGDFVKGPVDALTEFSAASRSGVALHRAIDSYTDSHPVFLRSKRRLQPPLRRYGGIIVDVFYDHFLAREWETYSSAPLGDFSASVYAALQTHYHLMPARMRRSVEHMIAVDLLPAYRDTAAVARALTGIERRLKRPCPCSLLRAHDQLEREHAAFGTDFREFFSELIEYAEREKRRLGVR